MNRSGKKKFHLRVQVNNISAISQISIRVTNFIHDFIVEKDLEAKVNGVIQKLSGSELKKFARVLLVKVNEGSTDSAVKRAVYEKAELQPIEVLEAWEDPERPLKELIRTGVIKKVFTTKNGRWSCEGALCGTSFETTLEWLKDNEDLLPKLRKQIFK